MLSELAETDSPPSVSRNQVRILAALLLVAACFYAVFIARSSFNVHGALYFTLIDDAMISMRYAQHLAQGNGLVWNIGERPIQGFTSPAWMLLMALPHLLRIPSSHTSLPVMVASGLILIALALVAYRICMVIAPRAKYAPLMASAITAFYFPLVFWSLRGMEVGLLTLLQGAALLAALHLGDAKQGRLPVAIGILLLLAIATRLDAAAQALVILVFVVTRRNVDLPRRLIPVAIAALAVIGILFAQRLYFGDALPNTYYQKILGAYAPERIRNGLLVFSQYATRDTLMLALFSAAAAALYKELRSPEAALLAALFLVQCAYSVWVGGDYAEPEVQAANRFITQGMPPLIILFSLGADRFVTGLQVSKDSIPARFSAGISLAIAAGVLLVISGRPWMHWVLDNAPLRQADIRRVRAGVAIAETTSPEATIAVHAAGQIPYYSNRRTIDLLGLNDEVIARGPLAGPFYPGHDKWDYDYSITQLKPDLIADNWIRLGDYMRDKTEYKQLNNGMYVRQDTTLVNVPALLLAYPR